MTTSVLNGFQVARDPVSDAASSVGAAQLTITRLEGAADTLQYSVIRAAAPPEDPLPLVEIATPDGLSAAIGTMPVEGIDAYIGQITYSGGVTQLLNFYDERSSTDYFFALGGDPLPTVTTVAQFLAIEGSVTAAGPITSGPLAPGTPISVSGLPGAVTSENDVIVGTPGADSLNAGAGNDMIDGGGGNDTLIGGPGNDTLNGGSGDDIIRGGGGTDTAVFAGSSTAASATQISGGFNITSGAGTDRVLGVDMFQFDDTTLTLAQMTALATGGEPPLTGTPGNDDLVGTDMGDVIDGLAGDDRLVGGDGDDTMRGGDGNDTINGGDGNDSIIGGDTDADRRDVIYGGAGNDSIDGGYGNDLIFGQGGNDTIAGGFGADELQGQDGDDVITGSAFGDIVFGNAGNDFVNGGFGHDLINGGTGADKFFHTGGTREQMEGHGSDWVQDYSSAEGDVLVFGGAGTADQFQVNTTHTANKETGERSGDDDVEEAFVIYKPTGQILWALVDGGGEASINLQIGAEVFDLLA